MEDNDLTTAGGMVVWGKLISISGGLARVSNVPGGTGQRGLLGKVCHSAALPLLKTAPIIYKA